MHLKNKYIYKIFTENLYYNKLLLCHEIKKLLGFVLRKNILKNLILAFLKC